MRVLPFSPARKGKSAALITRPPWGRAMSPPSYFSWRMGFTFSPEKAGAVSMWASRPRAGAPSQPGEAGSQAVTMQCSLTLGFSSPSPFSSSTSARARSHWPGVEGVTPVSSEDAVWI